MANVLVEYIIHRHRAPKVNWRKEKDKLSLLKRVARDLPPTRDDEQDPKEERVCKIIHEDHKIVPGKGQGERPMECVSANGSR